MYTPYITFVNRGQQETVETGVDFRTFIQGWILTSVYNSRLLCTCVLIHDQPTYNTVSSIGPGVGFRED